MVCARLVCVVGSAFAILLAACGGSAGEGTGPTRVYSAPDGDAQPGSPTKDGGVRTAGDSGTNDPDVGQPEAGPCAPYIGRWIATLDPGAVATGSDTDIAGGSVSISGTIDMTLSHDDADLPNIVDFTGTATIKGAGITITQAIQPAKSPSGDPKDSTCEGGLHFIGQANVSGIGNVVFTMDGTIDTTVTPTTGTGNFVMKTADDDGAALTGRGTVHMVHQ